jgi:hypothetical protein
VHPAANGPGVAGLSRNACPAGELPGPANRDVFISVFEALPAKQGGHRAALTHQSPRHPAAYQLQRGSLLEGLLDGHLHHVFDRLDRVAPAARARVRDRLQQASTFATTFSGLAENVIDDQGHHPPLVKGVERRAYAPHGGFRTGLDHPPYSRDFFAFLDRALCGLGRDGDRGRPCLDVNAELAADAPLDVFG